MEKLIYTTQKSSKKSKQIIKETVLSLSSGTISILCFISIFDIHFTLSNWYKGGISTGMACLWNKINNFMLVNEGVVLKKIAGAAEECELFIVMLMVIMSLLGWLILKSKNPWLILIYPLLICIPMIFTEEEPNILLVALLVLILISLYLDMKMEAGVSRWQIAVSTVIIAVLLAGVSNSSISELFERGKLAESADEKLEYTAERFYYGKNLINDGEITKEARAEATGKTALEVTMSTAESTYLRGFVGEMYFSEGQWKSLPNGTYSETANLFYWLKKAGFNSSGQIGQVNDLIESEAKDNRIEVFVKNANSKFAYIPYELISFDNEEVLISWYDGYFTKGNFGKLKEYGYSAAENSVKRWTDVTGKFFTAEKNDSVEDYLALESYYNEFVYQYYTYISDEEKAVLSEYFGDPGNQREGHIEYKTAIKKIEEYLQDNIVYTENPNLNSSEKSTVLEAFLYEGKGYDIHYATAATLMFRYYGIPARYIEGYLITPDDVKDAADGKTINISDGNIHAWTEIYVDGIGWVPVEMSPEYKGVMEEADMSIGLSNDFLKSQFEETNQRFQEMQKIESGDIEEDITPAVKFIISILILILVLIAVVIFALKAISAVQQVKKRSKLFKKAPAKIAVSAVYDYMNKLELDVHDEAVKLGNKAAYSRQDISEEERFAMLSYLEELKVEKRKNEKKKQKFKKVQ